MTNNAFQIRYSPKAVEDLQDILAYISQELQEPQCARNTVSKILETIKNLDIFPERFSITPYKIGLETEIRQVVSGNYVIFYTVQTESRVVKIIRIMYGKRDFSLLE